MKSLSLAAIGLFLLTGAAQAQSPDPSGTYLSESGDTRVRIARCGSAYCGTIVAVQGRPRTSTTRTPASRAATSSASR